MGDYEVAIGDYVGGLDLTEGLFFVKEKRLKSPIKKVVHPSLYKSIPNYATLIIYKNNYVSPRCNRIVLP